MNMLDKSKKLSSTKAPDLKRHRLTMPKFDGLPLYSKEYLRSKAMAFCLVIKLQIAWSKKANKVNFSIPFKLSKDQSQKAKYIANVA